MRITVIIRTMGRPTLERALASVRAQGLPDVQTLVVDARARSLRRAQAAQAGLDEVQTPWALFLDDDDELLPGHLKKLADAMQAHPQAVAAYTGVEQRQEGHAERLAVWDRAFEPWELLAANALPIHAVLFDAARVRQAGVRFDTTFDTFEDWDFWLQVQCLGPMVHTPGVSGVYWVAAPDTPQAPAAQSAAQVARHGDERYAAIWRKWWTLAPPEWWHQMWRAARDEPVLRQRFAQAEAARLQADSAMRQSEAARLQAESAMNQTEQASALTRQALDQANQAFNQARDELHNLQAIDNARQRELVHLQGQLETAHAQLADELAQHRITQVQRDEARIAEQGARWHLQAVLASRTWRVMAPVRWLGRQARRIWRLRSADARRSLWWRLRHRSFPRPALVAAVLPDPYQRWIEEHDGNGEQDRALALAAWAQLQAQANPVAPLISVLMPVYNPPIRFWNEAIESLQAQWYPNWELCIADDASTDPQVREHLQAWAARDQRIRWVSCPENGHISAASNAALALARGEWVALFDQDDLLPPQALWRVVQALTAHPDAGLIYSDEDKVDESGKRFGPYFKPAFDIDLLRGQNMISHLGVYRRSLMQAVGGFRLGYEGSQDHDLALRCIERLQASQVVHIPRVLYHWRVHQHSTASGQAAKPYALGAGIRAVQDHLQRCGVSALVQPHPAIPHHVVVHSPSTSQAAHAPTVTDNTAGTQATGSPALRILLWGAQGSAMASTDEFKRLAAVWPARAEQAGQNSSPDSVVSVADWREACVQLKAWAAQGQHGAVLLIEARLLDHLTTFGPGFGAVRAHLAESGVGAIGWALRDASGALHDAGWLRLSDGSARPLDRGTGRDTHGYYGRLCLAHRVSALNGAAVCLRLEALQSDLPGLQMLPGWRAVWSPLCEWMGIPLNGWSPAVVGNQLLSPLVMEAARMSGGGGDPAYSPHLCSKHADHRMAFASPRSSGASTGAQTARSGAIDKVALSAPRADEPIKSS